MAELIFAEHYHNKGCGTPTQHPGRFHKARHGNFKVTADVLNPFIEHVNTHNFFETPASWFHCIAVVRNENDKSR